ncbi:hypothetical protein [Planomicrobium okeanokoites]|nr:hypothetical protein [Planomicrobium okeanokoites]
MTEEKVPAGDGVLSLFIILEFNRGAKMPLKAKTKNFCPSML